MLYLSFFKKQDGEIIDPNYWMKAYNQKIKHWFDDQLVKDLIKEIDDCDCENMHVINSKIFGVISYPDLSTSVKNCIIAIKKGNPIDLALVGDNCIPILIKASETRDIYGTLYGIIKNVPDKFNAVVLNPESPCKFIKSRLDFINNYLTFTMLDDEGKTASLQPLDSQYTFKENNRF